MLYTVGHRQVLIPAPVPRTLRKQLAMRVRAASSASQYLSQTPPPPPPLKPDRTLTALMSQVVARIGDWWTPPRGDIVAESDILTVEELTDQLRSEMESAGMPEADSKITSADATGQASPNIWKFLKPVPIGEIQKSRFMASLANAAYCIPRLQFKSLLQRYGFHLVTTSLKCKQPAKNAKLVGEALMAGDGMGVGVSEMPQVEDASAMETAQQQSNIVSASALHGPDAATSGSTTWSERLGVSTVAGSVYTQALAPLARQVSVAATVSQSAVTDTVTRVMKLLHVALRPQDKPKMIDPPEAEERPGGVPAKVVSKCPTEWFVCDNEKKDTRIFCIQGTDNFESWQTNLTFDPVIFEDEALGLRVHRGVYEAAQGLYSLFVPLVKDHVESGTKKKISFTGHSLGGALASALMAMLVHRGDLPLENVGQVFTFGSPAAFLDTSDCNCWSFDSVNLREDTQPSDSALKRLGLPSHTVVNVMMHKDIVPRAFACDYSSVARLLRRWSNNFKEHRCLYSVKRTTLFEFIGDLLVLQPDENCSFVNQEGYHSLLPEGAGVFRLSEPDRETLKLRDKMMKQSAEKGRESGTEVETMKEAFMALMDKPHPLTTISDAAAYGHLGAMSRYHNPFNYIKALRSVMHSTTQQTTHRFGEGATPLSPH